VNRTHIKITYLLTAPEPARGTMIQRKCQHYLCVFAIQGHFTICITSPILLLWTAKKNHLTRTLTLPLTQQHYTGEPVLASTLS